MIDEIKLKLMKNKPTLDDIVKADTDAKTDLVFRVAMKRADKEQQRIIEKTMMT